MEISKPNLSLHLNKCSNLKDKLQEYILNEEPLENFFFESENVQSIEIHHVDFKYSHFTNTIIDHSTFNHCYFQDIYFENCDLSNVKFQNCLFRRVHFERCKLLGASIIDCVSEHGLITHSITQYFNLSNTKIKSIKFDTCNMKESSFIDNAITYLEILESDLTLSEFYHTSLFKVDLSTNNIDGIKITPPDLKGAIVSYYQAIDLSRLLGIEIKE